jgi:hypothetical protein
MSTTNRGLKESRLNQTTNLVSRMESKKNSIHPASSILDISKSRKFKAHPDEEDLDEETNKSKLGVQT